jgi:hypothetical protein
VIEVLSPMKRTLVSSPAWRVYQEKKRTLHYNSPTLGREIEKLKLDPPTLLGVRELFAQDARPHLLGQLANLHDEGYARFKKDYPLDDSRFYSMTEEQLLTLRDELRSGWGSGTHSIERHQLLLSWLDIVTPSISTMDNVSAFAWGVGPSGKIETNHQGGPIRYVVDSEGKQVGEPRSMHYSAIFPSLGLGRLVIDPRNLPAQIVQAVLEQHENMRICANPDCVVPYFLAKRRTQKYCESGACVDYGHRKNALNYWHRHKSKSDKQSVSGKKGTRNGKAKTNR